MKGRVLRDFLAPLAILGCLTALIAATGADISLTARFYRPDGGWPFGDAEPWRSLYRFGIYPAYLLAFSALAVLVAGWFAPRWRPFRKQSLFFVLLLLLGPGLVVNAMFKDHWGRPRPRQIQQFGGELRFHQIWEKGADNRGRSFPSGHASMAFYLLSPYFVLRNTRRRRLGRLCLVAGLTYGVLMGVARMAQGGHFPSDVLWAGGFVYLIGLMLSHLLHLDREGQ